MNIDDLVEILENEGYTEQSQLLKNKIMDLDEKIAIKLETIKANENDFEMGESKIGGCPHLKEGFKWPMFNGSPLAFLGQINLKEVSNHDSQNLLPSSGILYFFYEGGDDVWGFDPKDKEGFKVIYEKSVENLILTSLPEELDEDLVFSPCKLKFTEENTYSEDPYSIYYSLKPNNDEITDDKLFNLIANYYGENSKINTQLLGNPYLLQGNIFLESQLVSNGLYCGDETGYNNPKAKELESGVKNWILLFQLDSEDNADMMWGDFGIIYFTIKEEDLKNHDFGNIWFSYQCY